MQSFEIFHNAPIEHRNKKMQCNPKFLKWNTFFSMFFDIEHMNKKKPIE